MKLAIITNPTDITNEHEVINFMLEKGLEYLHIRKPDYSLDEMRNYIKNIPPGYHNSLVVHSHFELFEEFNLKGVHFGANSLKHFDDLKNTTFNRSVACHSTEELLAYNRIFKYAFLSPIFNSISKPNYFGSFSLLALKNFFTQNELKIKTFALGGIDETNIEKAQYIGFDGVAVLGAIWEELRITNDLSSAKARYKELANLVKICNAFSISNDQEFNLN